MAFISSTQTTANIDYIAPNFAEYVVNFLKGDARGRKLPNLPFGYRFAMAANTSF